MSGTRRETSSSPPAKVLGECRDRRHRTGRERRAGAGRRSGENVDFNPGPAWHEIGAGDFNGDGKADILWQNTDGTPAVWLMNGTSLVSGANVGFDPGSNWHVIPHHDLFG